MSTSVYTSGNNVATVGLASATAAGVTDAVAHTKIASLVLGMINGFVIFSIYAYKY
jgi:hypothetical protein